MNAVAKPAYLFVLPWSLSHVGGVNQVVINLGREMQRAGSYEPIVLVNDWESVDPVWQEEHGLRTVRWRIREWRAEMGFKESLAFGFWLRRFRQAFGQFCKTHQIAVVNVHYPGASLHTIDRLIGEPALPVPLIVSFHGADLTALQSASDKDQPYWRNLLQRVAAIIVCSKNMHMRVVDAFGKGVMPTVIHNGLDSAAFVALAGSAPQSPTRNILNVAKFETKKGQDVLIEAFASLADDYPDLRLVFVGATALALDTLRKLCIECGIADRVQFFPDTPHHEVAVFFRQASVFVLPSREEPFGIVLLEAGAFGLPVVASRVGGIEEILTDHVTGRLVAVGDAPALANAIRSLLDAKEDAAAMGHRLQLHVADNFTWAVAHAAYVRLAATAINAHRIGNSR